MKLAELFEDLAQSFEIDEYQLPNFADINTSAKIGDFDGHQIYGNRYNEQIDAYGILEGDFPIAVLYISNREQIYGGKKCQQIQKVWVSENHRGKGLAISLLAFVIRKTQTRLISNSLITADGELLYKRIIKKQPFDLEIYNKLDKTRTNIIPNDLFDYPNRYLIIMEKIDLAEQDFCMFEGRLKQHRLFVKSDGTSDWN